MRSPQRESRARAERCFPPPRRRSGSGAAAGHCLESRPPSAGVGNGVPLAVQCKERATVGLFMPTRKMCEITKYANFIGVEHNFASVTDRGEVNQDTLAQPLKYDWLCSSQNSGSN